MCLYLFAAVLRSHSDHVHGGLFVVTGGSGVGTWHPYILQVKSVWDSEHDRGLGMKKGI